MLALSLTVSVRRGKYTQWLVMDEKLFQMGPLRNIALNATSFLVPHEINKKIAEFFKFSTCQGAKIH